MPVSSRDLPPPPVAAVRPVEVRAPHGAVRLDDYYWLRDDRRQAPDVIAWLESENAYTDAAMRTLGTLRETLEAELIGRLAQDDSSVPFRDKDYWYATRFEEGKEYPIHGRRRGHLETPEEVMLDVNRLAQGHAFYQVAGWVVSPDQQRLAYLEDTVGRRQFTLRVKDLATGETLEDAIPGLAASVAWAGDGRTLYYVENDPVTLLTKRVRAHVLGTDPSLDPVVYEEPDDSFYVGVHVTRSEQYLCIVCRSTVSDELRYTDREHPGAFTVLAPRERGHEYDADHLHGRWVIRTNLDATNFRLMIAPDHEATDRARWTDLVPHDEAVFIARVELFDQFIAVSERSEGLTRLRILPEPGPARYVEAEETAYAMTLGVNAEPGSEWLRYVYSSLSTPATTWDLHVPTGERRLLKEEPVRGGFDRTRYVAERVWAPARDGARIPVSVLYRRGFRPDGTSPLLQYGYGAYGHSMDPTFNRDVISLVDRGVVYAIAHVRGGQEMGRRWYDAGRLAHKHHTFEDFVDVTTCLVARGFAAPDRVAAMGGSAGGLLMGAVANLAPDRYRAIVAMVPFLDVVTTMLDESIPLTTNEFDEWGDPKDPAAYAWMLDYSPYDQLTRRAYPAMFVSTGLWDSQVQYWEPAKYVARLRTCQTGDHPILLRTQMEAGHGGASGRFRRYRLWSEVYAFLVDQLGVAS